MDLAQIDTGSGDLWVVDADSQPCLNSCDQLHTSFNRTNSQTFKKIDDDFEIHYLDNTTAKGSHVSDTLQLGELQLQNFEFGLASSSSPGSSGSVPSRNTFGIGYRASESTTDGLRPTYDNLPFALAKAGYTKSAAYSLWLNDRHAAGGSILFGGVDTAKYEGELQTLPIVPGSDGNYTRTQVALSGVSISDGKGSSQDLGLKGPAVAILDSGSTPAMLPPDMINSLVKIADITYYKAQNAYIGPCVSGDLIFNFGSVALNVSIDQISWPIPVKGMCLWGILPSDQIIIGYTALRSMYVVYDLDQNQISLAPAKLDTTDSHILEINNGPQAVPSATAASFQISTAAPTATAAPISTVSVKLPGNTASSLHAVSSPLAICMLVLVASLL